METIYTVVGYNPVSLEFEEVYLETDELISILKTEKIKIKLSNLFFEPTDLKLLDKTLGIIYIFEKFKIKPLTIIDYENYQKLKNFLNNENNNNKEVYFFVFCKLFIDAEIVEEQAKRFSSLKN